MNPNYVDLILEEFSRRRNANFRYSERAFARDIGVSPGFLKLVIQRKKNLSLERAKSVAIRLGWTESKKAQFLKSHIHSKIGNHSNSIRSKNIYY